MKEAICKCLKRTALLAFSLLFVWGGAFGARAEEKEEVTISNILISENGKPVSGNPVFELEYPDGMKKEYITANGFLADLKLYKSEVHKLRLKDEMSYEMEELRIKAEAADALQTESGEPVLEVNVRRKENTAEQPVVLDTIFVKVKDGSGSATIPLTFVFKDMENGEETEYQSGHAALNGIQLVLERRYELSLKENYIFTMEKQIVKVGNEGGSYVLFDENYKRIRDIEVQAKDLSNEEHLTRVKEIIKEKIEEVREYLASKKFSNPKKVEDLQKALDDAESALKKENENLDNLENHLVKIDLKFRGIKEFEIKEEKKPEEPKQENPQKPMEPKQENPQKPEEPKSENPQKPEESKPENPKPENPKKPEESKPESPKPENPKKPEESKPENPKKEEKKQENPPSKKPEEKSDKSGNTGNTGNGGKSGNTGNTGRSGKRSGRSSRSTGRSTQKGKVQINTRAIAKKAEKNANSGMWVQDQKGWWYRNMDGSYPKSSWLQDKGKWYYFDAQGYMAKGWVEHTGKWYYLAEDGAMAVSTTTPDGYKVDATGAWIVS